jgi:anhydro-N-acetylmuramic acid kinase
MQVRVACCILVALMYLQQAPTMNSSSRHAYIGLMSGTSLDGVDGVLALMPEAGQDMRVLADAYVPFPAELRQELLALQQAGDDEIRREALAANQLAQLYAQCIRQLCAAQPEIAVHAAGVHGQTIRHRPELGYTRQTNNPALLAELAGVDIVADLRSRDVAAGGQGAPLVPAFHRAVFGREGEWRVLANIGGIANISLLAPDGSTTGFDTGPGNVLMDGWITRHLDKAYDEDGAWARSGALDASLLRDLCGEAYLHLAPPKSTGRDLFHMDWLDAKLAAHPKLAPQDVQATLCAFTAQTLAADIARHATQAGHAYVCGGGAYNGLLLEQLQQQLGLRGSHAKVVTTAVLGVPPNQVEALAFAWLAQQFMLRQPGNLPQVTGARGLRVLGALYPA